MPECQAAYEPGHVQAQPHTSSECMPEEHYSGAITPEQYYSDAIMPE